MVHLFVGIAGKMGTGKSSIARELCSKLTAATGDCWKIKSFATPLKELCASVYDLTTSKSTRPQWAVKGGPIPKLAELDERLRPVDELVEARLNLGTATAGRMYQVVGQAFRDAISPDFWIDAGIVPLGLPISFRQFWKSESILESNTIFDDVRYENEAAFIKSAGGFIVNVRRPDELCIRSGRDANHESENGLGAATVDFDFDNTLVAHENWDSEIAKLLNKLVSS